VGPPGAGSFQLFAGEAAVLAGAAVLAVGGRR
jgi:hypothetical protein